MKSMIQKLTVVLIISSLLSSCMMTKTQVGEFREQEGKEYTYAKAKQIWLFWGIVPLGRTDVSTPADGNCEVVTKRNFGDMLITFLTGGIVTTYTIKVNAKKKETN